MIASVSRSKANQRAPFAVCTQQGGYPDSTKRAVSRRDQPHDKAQALPSPARWPQHYGLQTVLDDCHHSLDQFHMVGLIFGDLDQAITQVLVGHFGIVRGLEVELTSILLDQLHRLELIQEVLFCSTIHRCHPVWIVYV